MAVFFALVAGAAAAWGLLIVTGVGLGFLLHFLLPPVDLGMAILIGVVSAGFSFHLFLQFMETLSTFHDAHCDEHHEVELPEVFVTPPALRSRARRGRRNRA
jgi:hypothetical protein